MSFCEGNVTSQNFWNIYSYVCLLLVRVRFSDISYVTILTKSIFRKSFFIGERGIKLWIDISGNRLLVIIRGIRLLLVNISANRLLIVIRGIRLFLFNISGKGLLVVIRGIRFFINIGTRLFVYIRGSRLLINIAPCSFSLTSIMCCSSPGIVSSWSDPGTNVLVWLKIWLKSYP